MEKKRPGSFKNPTDSFVAELYAIRQALYYLNEHDISSVTIYTDSKSGLFPTKTSFLLSKND
jgi:ribonuclease HI